MAYENGLNLWMDDMRAPPSPYWVWCKTVSEVKTFLSEQPVDQLSLDHDMGTGGETGYDLVKWCAQNRLWSRTKPVSHSMNPVGKANILAFVEKYWVGPAAT